LSEEFWMVDALVLARVQFGFTIAFHILFPAFSIGLASYLAVLEGLWLLTGRESFQRLYRYWLRVFALVFGMGVVSGVVMSYQIGTNWSVFADKTGPVLGPLMGYEVLSAFFLEAGFLGVMLFGLKRVGPGLHFFATLMVAAGTLISAFWILAANSWMQTPAGYAVNDVGQFVAADWGAVVFNPSFPYRFVHMVLACYLATAFAVGAVGAWHLLHGHGGLPARIMFSMALWMAALVTPLQVIVGDLHGVNTLEHQPAKIAAMEGYFDTQRGQPTHLFGLPDRDAEVTRYALSVPKLGSLILTHDPDGEVKGLKEWPKADRPNPEILFWSFRAMVGLGLLMLAAGLWSLVHRARGTLIHARGLMRAMVLLGPSGFIALLAGWITTEVGRQPYTVQGLLRTADSAAPIGAPGVSGSLAAFFVVYLLVFGCGVFYVLRLMIKPPDEMEGEEAKPDPARAGGMAEPQP
jgi:cytochrome d ubiquinol oxidase subunit I